MAGFGRLAAVEADRRQGASEVENYGRGPWQEGLRNSTLYVTLVALQYKCILGIGGHQHRWRSTTLIARWADLKWKRRWKEAAKAQDAATWNTPWLTPTLPLYEGLTKAESIAAFLLRIEVLGLNV